MKSSKKNKYFLGVYVAFFMFIISAAMNLGAAIVISKILVITMLAIYLFKENNRYKADFEKVILSILILLFTLLMFVRGKMQGFSEGFNIIYGILMMLMSFIFLVKFCRGIEIRKWFAENWMVLLIILGFAVMSIEVIDVWLVWDARIYYSYPWDGNDVRSMIDEFNADFANIYSLFLATHSSLGYSLWIILFQLMKEGAQSVQVADIFLAGISIFAYYQIVKKILGNKFSNRILSISTCVYAFSPFVLGMVGQFNLDSATMYFMLIFIACSLYHYEALELVFAFCFCFTKEPAMIYYTTYIIAKVLCEYISEHSFNFIGLIKFGLGNIRNYIYALPVIVWRVLSVLNSNEGWGGTAAIAWKEEGINCFGISSNVIIMKLKQIFLLNFNWIFWGGILAGGIILLLRKRKQDKEISRIMNPIYCTGVIMIIFGCVYVTWTHARYIVPFIPLLYLAATLVMANVFTERIDFCIWNVIIVALLILQSFATVDPVMKKVFHPISVGDDKIYSMQLKENHRIGDANEIKDSIVYNRQYIYWQETLMEMFNRSGYDGNMLIVLPDDGNCENYAVLGESVSLWNSEEKRMEYYKSTLDNSGNEIFMDTCRPMEAMQRIGVRDNNLVLYVIPGWADIDMDFVMGKKIIRQGEISNKGYNVKYMVMSLDYDLPITDNRYFVRPKNNDFLGLCTDGNALYLGDAVPVKLSASKTTYEFMFEEYQMALDVPNGNVDYMGSVQVWEKNDTAAQRWFLEQVGDYYMICWYGYALTYDLNDNSIRLTPKTGEDNQLWSFIN